MTGGRWPLCQVGIGSTVEAELGLRPKKGTGSRNSMARPGTCWTYIMASESGVLYVGVTDNLAKSCVAALVESHSRLHPEIQCDEVSLVRGAFQRPSRNLQREGDKRMGRMKKVKLIEERNPMWKDLSRE